MLSLIIPSMKMSTLEEKRWYHILTICVLMHLAFLMKHAVQQHRNWCQLVFGTFVAAAQDGIRIVRSGWERWLFDNLSLAWKLVPVVFLFSWTTIAGRKPRLLLQQKTAFTFPIWGIFSVHGPRIFYTGYLCISFERVWLRNNSLPAQCLQIPTDSQCRQCAIRTQYGCETSSMSCHDTVRM